MWYKWIGVLTLDQFPVFHIPCFQPVSDNASFPLHLIFSIDFSTKATQNTFCAPCFVSFGYNVLLLLPLNSSSTSSVSILYDTECFVKMCCHFIGCTFKFNARVEMKMSLGSIRFMSRTTLPLAFICKRVFSAEAVTGRFEEDVYVRSVADPQRRKQISLLSTIFHRHNFP